MSRELLARAWKAGAGPGDGPLTIDLDSTICETSYVGVGSPHRDGRAPTAGRGVQLLQPLAVQHVGLATRHVLDASGVHQHHLEVPLFQHPEQGYPVHAGGLHDHGLHTALGQPVRQTVQVSREGLELSNRLCGTVGGYRHEMAVGPHVDARRVQICLGKLRGQTLPPPCSLARRFCAPPACSHHLTPAMAVSARRRRKSLTVATLPNGIALAGASPMIQP